MNNQLALQQELDLQRRKIDVDHFDITVRELVRMSAEGELKRAPVYQRKFRWNEEAESRLIESLLLGLPVPAIFVATNPDGSWEVIDGLQRISTLLHFVADPPELLTSIEKAAPLELSGLVKLDLFEGLAIETLPAPVQLAFFKRALRVTALSDKSDMSVRFDMFERLNTGGVALSSQEVRACIFRGPFNDLLRELAEGADFRSLVKLQQKKQHDGTREEIVLKFFAYLHARELFDGAVTKFLNNYMEEATKSFDIGEGRELFKSVVGRLVEITEGQPMLRKGVSVTPLNQLEAVMVAAGDLLLASEPIKTPSSSWLNDEELVQASTGATNTRTMLSRRINRAKELLSN